jgi:hypothetical protein
MGMKEKDMGRKISILIAVFLSGLGMLSASYAAITVDLVGDGDGYDELNVEGFRSTGVAKAFDGDADNAYGTEGLFFFGDGDPNDGSNNPFTTHTNIGAAWATFSAGANFTSVAEGGTFSYGIIDDPTLPIAPEVANWSIRSAGGVANTPAGAGSWCEILTFEIDATTPALFRIGMMAGNLNSVNWNPSALRISVDGGAPVTVTNLPGTISQRNFVFFDVALNGESAGTFSIEAQRRAATQGASLAGVTFDEIILPDGATLGLDPVSLTLDLVAPDTSITGTITASYNAGQVTANDISIVSATADAGFSALMASGIGLSNPEETLTVTFDNSSIGLQNGESTNSMLEVIWTEIGSGVINTSSVPLDVTYINEPNRFALSPASLSLTLNDPDTSVNGTIVASYIEGTIPSDVEIVSVVTTNGFSVNPDSFTLGVINEAEDVLVTYANTGALVKHGDTAGSAVVVTWTVEGSGVTNTTEGAVDVFYFNPVASTTVIAGYDFDDGTGNATTAVTVKDVNVTASNYGVGAGLVDVVDTDGNSLADLFDAEGYLFGTANPFSYGGARSIFGFTDMDNADDLDLAITSEDYMVFTVTPTDDYAMDLTSFTFRSRVNNAGNSAQRWALFSSVDGFATAGSAITNGLTTVEATYANHVIDLSAAAFQGVEGGVEFRLYIYGGNESWSSATLFDKVIVNGAVYGLAIPPVSASVSGGSLVMSWEDGRIYNVLTNTYLPDANGWGVAETGVSSPVTNSIGSAPAVFFKLGK